MAENARDKLYRLLDEIFACKSSIDDIVEELEDEDVLKLIDFVEKEKRTARDVGMKFIEIIKSYDDGDGNCR